MTLQINQKAPNFQALDTKGNAVSANNFSGKNIVLYFYPKDNTPGCTLEAQEFSALIKEFAALDTVILGISKDNVQCHKNFTDMYGLQVNLLADTDGKICTDYGVIGNKKMFGKEYEGINRTTFFINKNGFIANIWHKVSASNHANKVLEFIKDYK